MENSKIKEDLSFKGIDQDTSFINYQEGKYFDALNMRIISDDDSTLSSLQNIKGNKSLVSVPDVTSIWKIKFDDTFVNTFLGSISIDINGTVYTVPVNATSYNLDQYLDSIVTAMNSNAILMSLFIKASHITGNDYIYVTTNNGSAITVNSFDDGGYDYIITEASVAQTGLRIIGWTLIRDDIYLLTTNGNTLNPGGIDLTLPIDPSTYGQIWKFTYNKITKIASPLLLIYNNVLNFSILHPIANPGGIEGRYETEDIQKIYWTDWFNVPRVINVKDPNIFSLDPIRLDLNTIINHNIPILNLVNQSSGSLITGIHQVAYRLKNTGGGETTFSNPSNLVHITKHSENLEYGGAFYTNELYEGSNNGELSTKSLTFIINDLDTNYDKIEVISLVREAIDQTPKISIINEFNVPNSGKLTFIYTGNEPEIPITLNEFNALKINFKKVKSIAEKNNKLFLGNVKLKSFDIDWDSRAYRFKSSDGIIANSSTDLEDKFGNVTTINSSNWTYDGVNQLPINHDAIQNYNSQSPLSWDQFIYQSNSTTIGGNGPNISYKFTTCDPSNPEAMILDSLCDMSTNTPAPYRVGSKYNRLITLDNVTNNVYASNTMYLDNHGPTITGLLKGYVRDEMYRFGIIFYDVLGNPGFVKWIGDIRFPHLYMPMLNSATYSTDRTLEYSMTDVVRSSIPKGELYGYNLGIEFTFDFSTISDLDKKKITGFSIVRVKREEKDKNIVAQGWLHPVLQDAVTIENYSLSSSPSLDPTSTCNYMPDLATFDSPEFYFKSNTNFSQGDNIDVIGILQQTTNFRSDINAYDGTVASGNRWAVIKNYLFDPIPPASIRRIPSNTGGFPPDSDNPYMLDFTIPVNYWRKSRVLIQDPLGNNFYNTSIPNNGPGNIQVSIGGDTLLMGGKNIFLNFSNIGGGDDYLKNTTDYDFMYSTTRMYLANYKRNNVIQYEGNSFTERSTNDYILCSNYFPLTEFVNPIITKIYGGDTFVSLYDHVKQFPSDTSNNYQGDTVTSGRFFPIESSINLELRQAEEISGFDGNAPTPGPNKYRYVFNKTRWPNLDVRGIADKEECKYNMVYSSENDIRTYFPKPDPYVPIEDFDIRIYNSAEKSNGELADSWGIYKEDDFIDVDGILGPINNLINLVNTFLFFQDKGVGKASIEERAAVATSTGDLTIGTGAILSRIDYITRESGSKHQFGFTKNDSTVWYFDIYQKTIFELSDQGNNPITDLKGLHTYFHKNITNEIITNDNPYINLGVTATYDYQNKEALFTFLDTNKAFTISYNTLTKSFVSFFSFTPSFYINDKYHIITTNANNNLYMHDEGEYSTFYDVKYPTKLTSLSNIYPKQTKILTNLEYLTEVIGKDLLNEDMDILDSTWDLIRVRNSKQNTDFQLVSNIGKRKERTWNIKIPKDRVQNNTVNSNIYGNDLSSSRILYGKKMRDKYNFIDFQYNNLNNYKLIMHYLTCILRPSQS